MTMMTIGVARNCATLIEQDVVIIMPGVGITQCWECEGTGDWTPFVPWEAAPLSVPCVDCKGTGKRHVDAWAMPEEKCNGVQNNA